MGDANSNRSSFKHRGLHFPTIRAVTKLHDAIVEQFGGLAGTKNAGLLESAVRKVVTSVGGEDAYAGLFMKAAAVGIAEGVIAAVKEVGLKVPLVVRLEGTNVDLGKDIIRKSGLNVIAADDLKDGAQKIVKAVRG